MEIFPNVHQIRSSIADRNLFQYLFIGDNVILLDTGFSDTPESVILPYLRKTGVSPERLTMAVNTHADADHHGGNNSLKHIAPQMLLACGDPDREVIENPDRLFASRYNHWIPEHGVGLGVNPEATTWVRRMTGDARRIDVTFQGGEFLAISDRHSIRVLHAPGHSNGHLAFYDPSNRAIFVGDALHGMHCPSASGMPSLPPAYFAVLAYLATIQLIEALDVEWIYSGHWPTYHLDDAKEFLRECRRFVRMAEDQVRLALERNKSGLTLGECIARCGPRLGEWPENNRWLLMYPLHGHLSLMESNGEIQRVPDERPTRWKLV